jgi:glycosyltransferase involved in cell wall biosynthesis
VRIVIDLTAVGSRGTIVYSRAFLAALGALDVDDELWVLGRPGLSDALALPSGHRFTLREVSAATSRSARVVWQLAGLGSLLRRVGADVLFAPFGLGPVVPPCPVLLAVRDPSPHVQHQQQYSRRIRFENRLRAWLVRLSCRAATKVLFPSHDAARTLGDALGLAESKRVVVYHGVDRSLWSESPARPSVLERYGVRDTPYLLFVSQLYRQKHPDVLIEAFARWIEASGNRRHHLLLAGREEESDFAQGLRALARRLGIEARVRFLGLVPHEDLPTLYRRASVFVLPTSMESFGQPFVEAMSSGVPVICADTPIAREICGDAAVYSPVGDAPALAGRLATVVDGAAGQRDTMIRLGKQRAAQFGWDREAAETLAIVREIAERRTTSAP